MRRIIRAILAALLVVPAGVRVQPSELSLNALHRASSSFARRVLDVLHSVYGHSGFLLFQFETEFAQHGALAGAFASISYVSRQPGRPERRGEGLTGTSYA